MTRPLPNSGSKGPPCKTESPHTRVRDGILLEHGNNLVVDGPFGEALELRKKNNTPLLHLVHSDDLKCIEIFGRLFKVFFQGFVV
jgi:hypothetical protein